MRPDFLNFFVFFPFSFQIEEFVANRIDDVAITNYRDNADFQDIIDGFQTGVSRSKVAIGTKIDEMLLS